MMLHHSNSRHQRSKASKIKTALQVALLLGVVAWLLYQVKHSYDKKNEYLDDKEDELTTESRNIFQGRKEKAGGNNGAYADTHGENFDIISKTKEVGVDHQTEDFHQHNEDRNGETVFEKENTESREEDIRNLEKSENEQGQVSNEDGNAESHANDGGEATGHSKDIDADGRSNESMAHSEESTNAVGQLDNVNQSNAEEVSTDPTNIVGEGANQREEGDSRTASETLFDATKIDTTEDAQNNVSSNDEHATVTLSDEDGNLPSVLNEDSQKDTNENPGDDTSGTSGATQHRTEAVHTETGTENKGTTSSGSAGQNEVVMPVDNEVPKRELSKSQSDNAVEAHTSDNNSSEGKIETGSNDELSNDAKSAETGTSNEASDSKEEHAQGENATAEATSNNEAANVQSGNSQSAAEAENTSNSSSGEETKPEENSNNGATGSSQNNEQADQKIETTVSTEGEHGESQGEGSSGLNSSSGTGNGLEQSGKVEAQ